MNTDVAFIPKDMILPIALGIMSFFLNFIGYFLFYISKKKSILIRLFMMMSLCECISNFSLTAILIDLDSFISFIKVKEIYDLLTFKNSSLFIDDKLIYKINMSLFNCFLNMNFSLNICYCYEVIQIFKNPISNSEGRGTYYFLISFICLVGSITHKLFSFEDFPQTYNQRLIHFWDYQ